MSYNTRKVYYLHQSWLWIFDLHHTLSLSKLTVNCQLLSYLHQIMRLWHKKYNNGVNVEYKLTISIFSFFIKLWSYDKEILSNSLILAVNCQSALFLLTCNQYQQSYNWMWIVNIYSLNCCIKSSSYNIESISTLPMTVVNFWLAAPNIEL